MTAPLHQSASLEHPIVLAVPVAVMLAMDVAEVLGEEERQQERRFLRKADAHRYRAAHVLVRQALASATGRPAETLVFDRMARGKPYLQGESGLDFNLSHSGDWVALGITRNGVIGVDVEQQRPESFWQDLLPSFLTPAEQMSVAAQTRADRFLRLWTAKESGVKAVGSGFAIPPDSFDVAAGDDGFSLTLEGVGLHGVWVELDEDHLLAVGTPGLSACVKTIRSIADVTKALRGLAPQSEYQRV